MNAYSEQSASSSFGDLYEGFAGMVMRFWRDVPPAMAEDAIDQILNKAKDPDAAVEPQFTLSSARGSLVLNPPISSDCSNFFVSLKN